MESFTAVFDGKVFVPDEPVDWPEGKVVEVSPREPGVGEIERMTPDDAFEWLVSHPFKGGGAAFDRDDAY